MKQHCWELYVSGTALPVTALCPTVIIAQKAGFRQIDIRGNLMLVNGLPFKLRGVNRHETYPTTGRALPPGTGRLDVEIFREANVNHLRTSHYPPGEEFLDAEERVGHARHQVSQPAGQPVFS